MSDPTSVELSVPVLDAELSSVNFFNGRLLVSGDLKAEQDSRRLAVQRVGQAVGQGVVEGLRTSLSPSTDAGSLALGIEPGTALNRQGAVLKLATAVRLEIVAPVERVAANLARAGFADCAPELRRIKPARNLLGFQILVARPDTLEKGRAPLVAMDLSAAGCNIDRIAQAVRFDLVPVSLNLPQDVPSDSPGLRNTVAHLLQDRFLSECGDGVPLALLRFDAVGKLDFLDMWAVRRRVARGLPGSLPSHPALLDANPWSGVFGDRTESVGEARILQFQDQLAQSLAQKLPLAGSGVEPANLRVQDVFPHLPAAGLFPDGFGWKAFLGATEIGTADPPVVAPEVADTLLREAASRPVGDAVPLNQIDSAKPLKVYRIANTQKHLFVRTQIARQWGSEILFDKSRLNPGWFPGATSTGHPSVQTALEDLYAKLQAKLPYQQSASDVKVATSGDEIRDNVQVSLQNLSNRLLEGLAAHQDAGNVLYDGSSVDAPSGSVKNSLDALHQGVRSLAGFSHVLRPADWTARLGSLSNDRGEAPTASGRPDLNLFFEAGVFSTAFPLVLSGFGHVRIQGAGAGTLLTSDQIESPLIVRDCLSCTVVDMSFRSGHSGSPAPAPRTPEGPRDIPRPDAGLGGGFAVERVPQVHLERLSAACAGSPARSSCAISVRNGGLEVPSRVVVRDCALEVGDEQIGLLVIDATEVVVTDSAIGASGIASPAGPRRLSHLATLLARHFADLATSPPPVAASPAVLPGAAGAVRSPLVAGLRDLPVATPPIRLPPVLPKTGPEWKRWIPANAWTWARGVAGQETDPDALFRRFLKKSNEALRGDGTRTDPFLTDLRASFLKHLSVLGGVPSRGIVVGGQIPTSVRIEGNRVSGAAIGILVGLSRRGTAVDRHDRILARSIRISGNAIALPDLQGRPGQRAGIQVGSAEDLRIEGNTVEVAFQSWDEVPCEALRAWGQFGRRVEVRGNRATGHQNGVWVRALVPSGAEIPAERNSPWTISDNLCEGAKAPVNLVGPLAPLFRLGENFG